jgi:enterochelin esterase family protein
MNRFVAGLLLLTVAPEVPSLSLSHLHAADLQAVTSTSTQTVPVISPEVHPDERVTFRLMAPSAAEVRVQGDFGKTRRFETASMTKDDAGVWSVTVGPVVPSVVRYTFLVDGVVVVDQRNSSVISGAGGVQNVVVIPRPADVAALRPVPHGDVRVVSYSSSSLRTNRRMHVYTPPGYDRSAASFPILYLFPGAGGDDAQWHGIGRAGLILDNLQAAGRARPMVVVMPDPRIPGQPVDNLPVDASQDLFTRDLLEDVLPYVQKNLRVRTGPEATAIAGLSTGGAKALLIALSHLDTFSQVGLFSSGWFPDDLAEVEKRHRAVLDDPATKKRLKVLWIGVGTGDLSAAYPNTSHLLRMFQRHGLAYEYHETDGDHTWINWRAYLSEFAPLLFK